MTTAITWTVNHTKIFGKEVVKTVVWLGYHIKAAVVKAVPYITRAAQAAFHFLKTNAGIASLIGIFAIGLYVVREKLYTGEEQRAVRICLDLALGSLLVTATLLIFVL